MSIKGSPEAKVFSGMDVGRVLRPVVPDSSDAGFFEHGTITDPTAMQGADSVIGRSAFSVALEEALDLTRSALKLSPLVPWFLFDQKTAVFAAVSLALSGSTPAHKAVPAVLSLSGEGDIRQSGRSRAESRLRRIEGVIRNVLRAKGLSHTIPEDKAIREMAIAWRELFDPKEIDALADLKDPSEVLDELERMLGDGAVSGLPAGPYSLVNAITRAGRVITQLDRLLAGRRIAIENRVLREALVSTDLRDIPEFDDLGGLLDELSKRGLHIQNNVMANDHEYELAGEELLDFVSGLAGVRAGRDTKIGKAEKGLIMRSVRGIFNYADIAWLLGKAPEARPDVIARFLGIRTEETIGRLYDPVVIAGRLDLYARAMDALKRYFPVHRISRTEFEEARRAMIRNASAQWLVSFHDLIRSPEDEETADIIEMRMLEVVPFYLITAEGARRNSDLRALVSYFTNERTDRSAVNALVKGLSRLPSRALSALAAWCDGHRDMIHSLLRHTRIMPPGISGSIGYSDKLLMDMPESDIERRRVIRLIETDLIPSVRSALKKAYGVEMSSDDVQKLFIQLQYTPVMDVLALMSFDPLNRLFFLKELGAIDPLKMVDAGAKGHGGGGGMSGGIGGLGGFGRGTSGPAEAGGVLGEPVYVMPAGAARSSADRYIFADGDGDGPKHPQGRSGLPSEGSPPARDRTVFMENAVRSMLRALYSGADLFLAESEIESVAGSIFAFFSKDELQRLVGTHTSLLGITFMNIVDPSGKAVTGSDTRSLINRVRAAGEILMLLGSLKNGERIAGLSEERRRELRQRLMSEETVTLIAMFDELDTMPERDLFAVATRLERSRYGLHLHSILPLSDMEKAATGRAVLSYLSRQRSPSHGINRLASKKSEELLKAIPALFTTADISSLANIADADAMRIAVPRAIGLDSRMTTDNMLTFMDAADMLISVADILTGIRKLHDENLLTLPEISIRVLRNELITNASSAMLARLKELISRIEEPGVADLLEFELARISGVQLTDSAHRRRLIGRIAGVFEEDMVTESASYELRSSLALLPAFVLEELAEMAGRRKAQLYAVLRPMLLTPAELRSPADYSSVPPVSMGKERYIELGRKLWNILNEGAAVMDLDLGSPFGMDDIQAFATTLWNDFPAQFLLALSSFRSPLTRLYVLGRAGLIKGFRNEPSASLKRNEPAN